MPKPEPPLCAMCGRTAQDHDPKANRNITPGARVHCTTFVHRVGVLDPKQAHVPDERLPKLLA